jgi:PHP-associated
VVARYRDLGYDFLAITDHDDRVAESYWFQIPSGDDRMIVFPGIELDFRPLSQHVGKVVGDRETLLVLNHPARYNLSVSQVRERIGILAAAGLAIDAVEVTDTGVYQPRYDVDAIPLPKVATDDSHRDRQLGRAWIEVEAPRSRDGILRAIKAGHFRIACAPAEVSGPGHDLLSLGY